MKGHFLTIARKNQLIFRATDLLNFSRADVLLFPFIVQERGTQKRRSNFFLNQKLNILQAVFLQ